MSSLTILEDTILLSFNLMMSGGEIVSMKNVIFVFKKKSDIGKLPKAASSYSSLLFNIYEVQNTCPSNGFGKPTNSSG